MLHNELIKQRILLYKNASGFLENGKVKQGSNVGNLGIKYADCTRK